MNKILYMLTSLSLLLGINQELARLWSKYESAERADKPADMVAALEQIRSEAESRRLDWDYYDASVKWIAARSLMDWKLSSESRKVRADIFALLGIKTMSMLCACMVIFFTVILQLINLARLR